MRCVAHGEGQRSVACVIHSIGGRRHPWSPKQFTAVWVSSMIKLYHVPSSLADSDAHQVSYYNERIEIVVVSW